MKIIPKITVLDDKKILKNFLLILPSNIMKIISKIIIYDKKKKFILLDGIVKINLFVSFQTNSSLYSPLFAPFLVLGALPTGDL